MIWKLDKPRSEPEIISVSCLGISVMTHIDGRVSYSMLIEVRGIIVYS